MSENKSVQIAKALNEEKRLATYVVLIPDQEDLHNHVYDASTVEDACISFNSFCRKSSLAHIQETELFTVVQSWITPVDMVLGNTFVKKGAWLATILAHSLELWQDMKDGKFTGLSIGAWANVEDID